MDDVTMIRWAAQRGTVQLSNGDHAVLHAWYPPTSRANRRQRAKVVLLDGTVCYPRKVRVVRTVEQNP